MKKMMRALVPIVLTIFVVTACGNRADTDAVSDKDSVNSMQTETSEESEKIENQETIRQAEDDDGHASDNLQDEAATEAAKPEEPASVSLIMVGDVLLHTPVEESAQKEDGTYDFSAIFANTAQEIAAADLALVNQEVIIGGAELGVSGYPGFNAPYEIGDELVETGFDVICHATNHALDKRKKGLLNCMSFWQDNYPDIAVLGIYDTSEARDEIYVYEQDGIKIAILNYTYGTNGIELPEGMPYAVNLLDKEQVISDLKKADELADFTIVCPHWGTEYELEADSDQKKWAKLFAAHGVDLVIGTHPHVIEPVEWVHDEETGNDMLVYYSLGNFVNWTSGTKKGTANRMVGGMAEVTIGYLEDGSVGILDYGVKALISHVEKGFGGVTTYRLCDYSEELAQKNAIRNQDDSFSYAYAVELCDKVWGDLWE